MKFEIFKFVYPVVIIGILSFYEAKYYEAKFAKHENELNEVTNNCCVGEMILLFNC